MRRAIEARALPHRRRELGLPLCQLAIERIEGGRLVVWTAPPARADLPTVFFFHGNASDVSGFAEFGEAFHRQGWGVVLTDYRGYSGNSGKPSEEGLFEDARTTLAAVAPMGPVLL